MCWNLQLVDDVLRGACTVRCEGSPDNPLCEPGTSCFDAAIVALCTRNCGPLEGCFGDPPFGCYLNPSNTFYCLPPGEGEQGDPCIEPQDCAPGYFCAAADAFSGCDADGCCALSCDLYDPICDIPGTECALVYEDYWGEDLLGACLVPGA